MIHLKVSSCVPPKGTVFHSIGRACRFWFGRAGVFGKWICGWSGCVGGVGVGGSVVSAREVVKSICRCHMPARGEGCGAGQDLL